MKNRLLTLILSLLGTTLTAFAQQTMDVKLKITYKNAPLCNWEVTIKHGDMTLAKGTTDQNGIVQYKYVRLLSRNIDAYGYKPIKGGDKKWDVKGYIRLDENGYAAFDFQPLLEDSGMPVGMMEAAWGLTLNDCGGTGGSSGSAKKEEPISSQKPAEDSKNSDQATKETSAPALMTPEERMNGQKTMLENRIDNLNAKIQKRTAQRDKEKEGSKEYSELSYDIRDLELERDLAQVKLERVNAEIAKGYTSLNKSEKAAFDIREDALKEEQKTLKKQQKDNIPYGGTATEEKENAASGKKEKNEEEIEEDATKTYTPEELAAMSSFQLKKLKIDSNTTVTKRKLKLKTKSAFLTPEEKNTLQQEIDNLNRQVENIEAELAKRNEKEE